MWDLRRSSWRWLIWDMSSQRIMLTQPCRYQWAVTTSQSFFVASQGWCALSRLLLGSVTRSFRITHWLLFLRSHTSTVVSFDLLPLNLTGGHSRMAFWKSPDAYGSAIAANPTTLSLSKYLDLATPFKESTYSLKGTSSPLPPVVIYMLLHRSFPPMGVVSTPKGEKNSFTRFCGIYLYADTHLPLLSCKLQIIVFISTGALDRSTVLLLEAFLWSGRPV